MPTIPTPNTKSELTPESAGWIKGTITRTEALLLIQSLAAYAAHDGPIPFFLDMKKSYDLRTEESGQEMLVRVGGAISSATVTVEAGTFFNLSEPVVVS